MKFVEVDKIPNGVGYKRNNLQVFLKEFYTENIKIAKIDFKDREYKSPEVAARVISQAIKTSCLPIRAIQRKDEVFLLRTDM